MLQNTKNNARQQATFLLSTLAASLMLVQQGYAATPVLPVAGSAIKNTAYATYISLEGRVSNIQSNTVQVEVAALYAISLSMPTTQHIEAGARVVWLNTLTNTSNTQASISIQKLAATGLSNIKVYVDTNKNGEFDASDEVLNAAIVLSAQQSVNLWVVATAATTLQDKQQLNLPITAVVVQDPTVTATATDSLITYLPQLYANKTVDQENFNPLSSKNFDLNYTLTLENKGMQAIRPTRIFIDGQAQDMVVMVDALPANTTYKNAQSSNANAIILFKTSDNNYTRQQPTDLTSVNELVVAFPSIAAQTTERVQLAVRMNTNVANLSVNNQFQVKYQVAAGEKTTLSNIAKTVVAGKSEITNNSGNYSRILATGSLNKPLFISADSAICNAGRSVTDQVKIQIKSTLTGDVVEVVGVETAPNSGVFHYQLATTDSKTANVNDQVLQTVRRDKVLVSLVSCLDAAGNATTAITDVNTDVLIDPYGIVFDAKTGKPLAGATVTLLDASGQPIGNNVAFNVDLMTGNLVPIGATQVTNAAGEFVYPQVIAGTYSFVVDTSTIAGTTKYTFVSDKSVYSSFPANNAVNPEKKHL